MLKAEAPLDRDASREQATGSRRGLNGIGRKLKEVATGATPSRADKARRAAEQRQKAEEREALRAAQNPTARAVHTRNALLRWAHREYQRGDRTPSCNGFMGSVGAAFEEIPLEVEDLREALNYLADRNLVELIHKVNWTDPGYQEIHTAQRLSLTRLGLDCAESGLTVSEFLYPRPTPSGDTYNTTVQSGAQGIQIGRQNTMSNTWGLEPNALLQFAKEVLAKVRELGLDTAAEGGLVEEAEALRDEASAREPNPTALRRASDSVMGTLGKAPESTIRHWLQLAGAAAINNDLGGR